MLFQVQRQRFQSGGTLLEVEGQQGTNADVASMFQHLGEVQWFGVDIGQCLAI